MFFVMVRKKIEGKIGLMPYNVMKKAVTAVITDDGKNLRAGAKLHGILRRTLARYMKKKTQRLYH